MISPLLSDSAVRLPANSKQTAKPLRITHLITGLHSGGAENMLLKLLSRMDSGRFESDVISLLDGGPIADRLSALGILVRSLGMSPGRPNLAALVRLSGMLRKKRPDILQTWMPHSDLAGGIVASISRAYPVIWNIRHSNIEESARKPVTDWTIKICARLSAHVPEAILSCSQVAMQFYADHGYCREKMRVIPNGFDVDLFRPDPDARAAVRRELNIDTDTFLIGRIGRFHPQKDYKSFVQCASAIIKEIPKARFLLCGAEIVWSNKQLAAWIDEAGLRDSFFLLGPQSETHRLYAALDLNVSSSAFGEAFPNVVGEAMACGVPCVVTDVGDSAIIVGDTGLVAKPGEAEQLAAHCIHLLRAGPEEMRSLGARARKRMIERYSISSVARQYEDFYFEVHNRIGERKNAAVA